MYKNLWAIDARFCSLNIKKWKTILKKNVHIVQQNTGSLGFSCKNKSIYTKTVFLIIHPTVDLQFNTFSAMTLLIAKGRRTNSTHDQICQQLNNNPRDSSVIQRRREILMMTITRQHMARGPGSKRLPSTSNSRRAWSMRDYVTVIKWKPRAGSRGGSARRYKQPDPSFG